MKPVGANIYCCNFDVDANKIKNQIPKTKIKALIMGSTGAGKTTFMNRACNTNYDSGIKSGSCTKDIACQNVVQFPEGVFKIYDTPGTDSKKQSLQHAKVLRASLTAVPLNLILIQVKFDERWERSFQQFLEQFKIFKKYSSLVVMLISRYDQIQIKDKKSALIALQEAQRQYKIKCPIILYSNKTSNIKTVTDLLYSIGTKNQPLPIEIDDQVFYQHFKTANPIKIGQVGDYINEIEKKCQIFIKAFRSLNKNVQDIDEYVADLKMYMKYELKRFQDEQYKKYNAEFNDGEMTHDLYLRISKITHDCMQQADIIADKFLTKSVYEDYYKKTTDIRDMFKACPKCGIIWMKVRGCDDTYCGNRPTNYFDYFANKNAYRHQFKIENEKLISTKNEMSKPNEQQITQQRKQIALKVKFLNAAGCNTPMLWDKLDRLPNIEEILQEYYGTSNYSEIKLDQEFVSKDHEAYQIQIQKKVQKTKQLMNSTN